jgi:hypothetical protein
LKRAYTAGVQGASPGLPIKLAVDANSTQRRFDESFD